MLDKLLNKNQLLSIVTPVYNEEGNVGKFYQEIAGIVPQLNALGIDYELIFVNDGSQDNSIVTLQQLAQTNPKVKIVNLSRNFGHQIAITAGIDYAKGDALVLLDSDLQDPPAVIIELVQKWQQGYQVVNAVRRTRDDDWFKSFTATLFYKLLNLLLTNKIPENVGDFRLLDRRAVEVLKRISEKDRYLRGLANWIGFNQAFVEFDRDKRYSGTTHYPLHKMFGLALNAVFSFSRLPMKLAAIMCLVFIVITFSVSGYALYVHMIGSVIPGWTSLVIIVSAFSVVQMLVLTIISEYVGRIYVQVQDRPLYVVAETLNVEDQNPR